MALLSARSSFFRLIVTMILVGFASRALADGEILQGIDMGVNGSAGPGSIYSTGASLSLELGDDEDEDNLSGDLHADFLNDLSPQDSSVAGGPLKAVGNWSGGATVNLHNDWTIGLDLRSVLDSFEQISTNEVKLSVGRDFWTLSFQHGRNAINQSFSVPTPSAPGGMQFLGAFIYQEMAKLELDLEVGSSNTFRPSVSGSIFSPDANAFATLLSRPIFSGLSNFQDTLTSFELWSLGLSWKHDFSKDIKSELSATYGYLIIGPGNSIETVASVSFPILDSTTGKIGWQYTYDPSSHSNAVVFEVRTRWEP